MCVSVCQCVGVFRCRCPCTCVCVRMTVLCQCMCVCLCVCKDVVCVRACDFACVLLGRPERLSLSHLDRTGVGNLVQTVVLVALLAAFGQTSADDSALDPSSLQLVWRLQYAVAVLLLACLVAYRVKYTLESTAWSSAKAAKAAAVAADATTLLTTPARGASYGTERSVTTPARVRLWTSTAGTGPW